MMIQENHVYFPLHQVLLLIISVCMGSKDHGVQQKLIQMVIKLCGATAIWHALAGCLWGHQMLVELVLVGQA